MSLSSSSFFFSERQKVGFVGIYPKILLFWSTMILVWEFVVSDLRLFVRDFPEVATIIIKKFYYIYRDNDIYFFVLFCVVIFEISDFSN